MEMRGKVIIDAPIRFGMIRIGEGFVGIFDRHHSRSIWQVSGTVIFHGNADIGHGSKVVVDGILELGNNFCITAESAIIASTHVTFGKDVLISWENLFMDTDFHKIYRKGEQTNPPMPIQIGDHVWIGCRCTILKGTVVPSNTVIAANSLLVGAKWSQESCILGGSPAKILMEEVSWQT